jgi:hypothetical protein
MSTSFAELDEHSEEPEKITCEIKKAEVKKETPSAASDEVANGIEYFKISNS